MRPFRLCTKHSHATTHKGQALTAMRIENDNKYRTRNYCSNEAGGGRLTWWSYPQVVFGAECLQQLLVVPVAHLSQKGQ